MDNADEISDETTTKKAKVMNLGDTTYDSADDADEDIPFIKPDWGDCHEDVGTSITKTTGADTDSSSIMQRRLTVLVKEIGIAANSVHTHLEKASSTCQQLRDELHEQVTVGILKISAQESQLGDLQSLIERLASDIGKSEQQVTFFERVVREREVAVQNAEREIQEATARVERARKCRSKRRRKRFLGISDWWRNKVERPISQGVNVVVRPISQGVEHAIESTSHVVEEGLIKPICSIVNIDGIDRAVNARDTAIENRNDAQSHLSHQREELQKKRHQLRQVEHQRHVARADKLQLETTHAATKKAWNTISSLFDQFKIADTYLVTVLVPSKQMVVDIKRLINFDLLIAPLKTLADQMIKDQIMPSFDFQISQSHIAEVDRILNRLEGEISKLPLLIEYSLTDEVVVEQV